ncbi:autophagy-related protein 16-1-like isoform X3 [Anolis carolinensis]|uniref:autophagy-related protein 16-1-like isoform X3 n=1 Tax=Anolis carolinensis TaxID=28377 RepID=UPI002F2B6835
MRRTEPRPFALALCACAALKGAARRMKQSGSWRQHLQAELRRREGRAAGWRAVLERHEHLQERLEAQQVQLAEGLLGLGGDGPGRDRGSLDLAALHLQLQVDVAQLRREREELRQQVTFLAEVLRETEAENQEQRARMGRLAQEASTLGRDLEEAQVKAWSLRLEAEGLRGELCGARGLLRQAQRERTELEARYQRKVTLLQEKLERMKEANGGMEGETPLQGSSLGSSSEEADMDTGGGSGQAEPRPVSPEAGRGRNLGEGSPGSKKGPNWHRICLQGLVYKAGRQEGRKEG